MSQFNSFRYNMRSPLFLPFENNMAQYCPAGKVFKTQLFENFWNFEYIARPFWKIIYIILYILYRKWTNLLIIFHLILSLIYDFSLEMNIKKFERSTHSSFQLKWCSMFSWFLKMQHTLTYFQCGLFAKVEPQNA